MKKFIKRLNIKPPSKKFLSREILIMIILAVISTSVYLINEKRNSNIRSNIEKAEAELMLIQNKIDGTGGAFFKHWILLKDYGAFEGNYENFVKEYGDYSKSKFLFSLTQNNGLYKSYNINDFEKKMYFNNYHLANLYNCYGNTYKPWYYYKSHKFSEPKMTFSEFKKMLLSNEDFLKKNYLIYVVTTGWDSSVEMLKATISTDFHYVDTKKYYNLIPDLELKKSELNKLKDSSLRYIEEYILIFILFVYGLRVFVSIVRWSIKQLS